MDKNLIFPDLEFLLKFDKNSLNFLLAFTSRVPCRFETYFHENENGHNYDVYGVMLYPIGFDKFGYDECCIDVDHFGNMVYFGSKIPHRVERVILDVIRDYELLNRVVPADLDLVISEYHYQYRQPEVIQDVY